MRALLRCQSGMVSLEFVAVAPVMILLVLGVSDIGMLAARASSLEAATRAGAEYARVDSGPSAMNTIQAKVSGYRGFSPAVTAIASRKCECDDGNTPSNGAGPSFCFDGGGNAAVCSSGPTHVYVSISATQSFTPLTPLAGVVFPSSLSTTVTMRVQ